MGRVSGSIQDVMDSYNATAELSRSSWAAKLAIDLQLKSYKGARAEPPPNIFLRMCGYKEYSTMAWRLLLNVVSEFAPTYVQKSGSKI